MNSHILDRLDAMEAWVRRRRWWIRLAVALVLVPSFARFAYTHVFQGLPPVSAGRLHYKVVPATPTGSLADPAITDQERELLRIANSLPKATFTLPAGSPYGYWGASELSFREALRGPWEPANRSHLQQVVQYLDMPAVQAALKEVTALTSRPDGLSLSGRGDEIGKVLQQLETVLLVRARRQMAENQDFEAAVADLRTAMQLWSALRSSSGALGQGYMYFWRTQGNDRDLDFQEMLHWVREFDLSAEQIRVLRSLVQSSCVDPRQAWHQALQTMKANCQTRLDTCYSKDASGNGWPILWRRNPAEPFNLLFCTINLSSPVFNDRRTMQRKIDTAFDAMEGLFDLPVAALEDGMYRRRSRSATASDFVFADVEVEVFYTRFESLEDEAWQSGAVVGVALGAYKAEHGEYPRTLAQLVPMYLPAVPKDPYNQEALGYILDEEYGCILYGAGPGRPYYPRSAVLLRPLQQRGIAYNCTVLMGPREDVSSAQYSVPPSPPATAGTARTSQGQ